MPHYLVRISPMDRREGITLHFAGLPTRDEVIEALGTMTVTHAAGPAVVGLCVQCVAERGLPRLDDRGRGRIKWEIPGYRDAIGRIDIEPFFLFSTEREQADELPVASQPPAASPLSAKPSADPLVAAAQAALARDQAARELAEKKFDEAITPAGDLALREAIAGRARAIVDNICANNNSSKKMAAGMLATLLLEIAKGNLK